MRTGRPRLRMHRQVIDFIYSCLNQTGYGPNYIDMICSLEISSETIARHLRELEASRQLTITRRTGRRNLYEVHDGTTR